MSESVTLHSIEFSARAEPIASFRVEIILYEAFVDAVESTAQTIGSLSGLPICVSLADYWCRASSRNGLSTDGTAAIVLANIVSTDIECR
ncbi:MAG: hypothetical protein IKL83_07595 [Muribaculaceae bacterium]|nr:hypothetical protein [Muribaculaceae bacterium]